MHRTAIAAVVVGLALLAACGSDGDDDASSTTTTALRPTGGTVAAPAPSRPACELLSREEVSKAVGNPVRPGTGSGRDCLWGTDVDGGTSPSVTAFKPGPATAQECALQRDVLPKEAKREQVGGLGTSAAWVWEQFAVLTQGRLLACWDDAVVLVYLTGEKPPAELRGVAITLAEQVRARI